MRGAASILLVDCLRVTPQPNMHRGQRTGRPVHLSVHLQAPGGEERRLLGGHIRAAARAVRPGAVRRGARPPGGQERDGHVRGDAAARARLLLRPRERRRRLEDRRADAGLRSSGARVRLARRELPGHRGRAPRPREPRLGPGRGELVQRAARRRQCQAGLVGQAGGDHRRGQCGH